LDPHSQKHLRYYIKKSEYELKEGWLPFGSGPKQGKFYSFDKIEVDTSSVNRGIILEFDFSMDPLINQFQRHSLTFFEAFGTIGGIFEILNIITGLFTGYYAQYAFRHSLLKSLKKLKSEAPILVGNSGNEAKQRDRSQLYVPDPSSSVREGDEINPFLMKEEAKKNLNEQEKQEKWDLENEGGEEEKKDF